MESRESRIITPPNAQIIHQRLAGNRDIDFVGVNSKIFGQAPLEYYIRGNDKDIVQYTTVVGAANTSLDNLEGLNYLFDRTLEGFDYYSGESAYGIGNGLPKHFSLRIAFLKESPMNGVKYVGTYFSIFPNAEVARLYLEFLDQLYCKPNIDYGNFSLMQLYNNLISLDKLKAWIDLDDLVSTSGLQKTLTLGKRQLKGPAFEL